jgi:hypothetical protein
VACNDDDDVAAVVDAEVVADVATRSTPGQQLVLVRRRRRSLSAFVVVVALLPNGKAATAMPLPDVLASHQPLNSSQNATARTGSGAAGAASGRRRGCSYRYNELDNKPAFISFLVLF